MPIEVVDAHRDPHLHLRETVLSPLIDEHGPLVIVPHNDPFQRLVVSILRQQVSMASAAAIRERLFESFEITPQTLASADPEGLQEVGLSTAKADYVRNVAHAFEQNEWGHDYFADMDDDEVADELTEVKGVGPWTAKMFLQFGLGRQDIFALEDLGIRKGMEVLYGDLTRAEMREYAEAWKPYRSTASLYLWRAYEG